MPWRLLKTGGKRGAEKERGAGGEGKWGVKKGRGGGWGGGGCRRYGWNGEGGVGWGRVVKGRARVEKEGMNGRGGKGGQRYICSEQSRHRKIQLG